jgi:putative Ca2+/H+ antiporter (TMEM165/GDT1 family)
MAVYFTVFLTILIAELGDKTQIAVMSYGLDKKVSNWGVFLASSCALTVSSGIAVLAASMAERYLTQIPLKLVSGSLFLVLGSWTLFDYFTNKSS